MWLYYGNIGIRANLCSDLSFSQFEERYGEKLKGYDLKAEYKKLGGKLPKQKPKKEEYNADREA